MKRIFVLFIYFLISISIFARGYHYRSYTRSYRTHYRVPTYRTRSYVRNYTPHCRAPTYHARTYRRSYTPRYYHPRTYHVRSRNYATPYPGTHWVRTYRRRDGTIVRRHLAGNPGSGIHCHNNVCYYGNK